MSWSEEVLTLLVILSPLSNIVPGTEESISQSRKPVFSCFLHLISEYLIICMINLLITITNIWKYKQCDRIFTFHTCCYCIYLNGINYFLWKILTFNF